MKYVWAICLAIVIVIIIGFNIRHSSGEEKTMSVETGNIEIKTIKESVMVPGSVQFTNMQVIYHEPDKGEIDKIFVEAGDEVEVNDILFQYENNQLTYDKEQLLLQLDSVTLELNHVRNEHKEIDKKVEKDKQNELLQQEHDEIKLRQLQLENEYESLM